MSAGSKLVWPALTGAAGAMATTTVRKAYSSGWRFVTGQEPPRQPEDPDTPWPYAFAWALGSAVALEGARLVLIRRAAGYWRNRTGELPPLPSGEKKGKKKVNGTT